MHTFEWCRGLTGAEAQPQVITFLIFCFNLRFSDSLERDAALLEDWKALLSV
jgi:hypothetical protein